MDSYPNDIEVLFDDQRISIHMGDSQDVNMEEFCILSWSQKHKNNQLQSLSGEFSLILDV
jgi:hypothetical protein